MRRSVAVFGCLVCLVVGVVVLGVGLARGSGGLVQLVAFGAQDVYLNANGTGGVTLTTSGPTDVVTQTVTYPPGETSGWHNSEGVALFTVTHGTATVYQADCSSKTFSSRQAFVESGQHPSLLANQSHGDLVVYETHIVSHGSPLQTDQPNPGCSAH
jgi:hypothetical protein